jgi:hypothetical protein
MKEPRSAKYKRDRLDPGIPPIYGNLLRFAPRGGTPLRLRRAPFSRDPSSSRSITKVGIPVNLFHGTHLGWQNWRFLTIFRVSCAVFSVVAMTYDAGKSVPSEIGTDFPRRKCARIYSKGHFPRPKSGSIGIGSGFPRWKSGSCGVVSGFPRWKLVSCGVVRGFPGGKSGSCGMAGGFPRQKLGSCGAGSGFSRRKLGDFRRGWHFCGGKSGCGGMGSGFWAGK